jgi:hypothetical protein
MPITFSALPRIRLMFQRFIQAISFPPGWRAPRVPWGVSKLIRFFLLLDWLTVSGGVAGTVVCLGL